MLSFLFPDKPTLKAAATSLTAWGVFLAGAAQAAELAGFLTPGVTEQLATLAQSLAPFLVVLGLRKAAGKAAVAQ